MKALITNQVIPKLRDTFQFPYILHKTLLTYGLGKSAIAQPIETFEKQLPKHVKLAYLPNLGRVRLRLSGKSTNEKQLEADIENQTKRFRLLKIFS